VAGSLVCNGWLDPFTAYAMTVASFLHRAVLFAAPARGARAAAARIRHSARDGDLFRPVLPLFVTSEALRRIGANQVALIGALGPVTTFFSAGWDWTRP